MKSKNIHTALRGALAVPAAALMLGAAEAGSTVGLNFQAYYYDSGTTPQTVGTGYGYLTAGFPVTARAFGVEAADWTNTDPLPCASFTETISFGGTLSAEVTAANMWMSGFTSTGTTAVWGPSSEVQAALQPGNHEVTWGILDNTGWSVTLSNLNAKFPNGYVVDLIGATKVKPTSSVSITENAGSTLVGTVTFTSLPDGMGVGVSPVLNHDSITLSNDSRDVSATTNCAIGGLIITDKPVVDIPPVDIAVATGGSFTLTAGAVGLPPLTYQWRRNGTPISGQTAATLTKSGAATGDSGSYDVVVTNAYGTTTSDAAAVTVAVPATVTWDADTGGAGAQDGSGTWDTTNTNWWNGTSNVTWVNTNSAVFGSGGAGPNTVTLASNISTGGLTFNGVDYTIEKTSGQTLTLGSGGINNSGNATINVPVTSSGLTKTGAGVLTLTTNSAISGAINIQQGTLNLPNQPNSYWNQWLFTASVINLSPGTSLTCSDSAFGWYGNNNATGLTINIDGATCQSNGAFGIGYVLTGGTVSGSNRLDMGRSGGFDSFISSKASSTTSVVNPGGGILFRPDAAAGDVTQPDWTFTTEAGTTPGGIDLDIPANISQNGGTCPLIKNGPGTLRLGGSNSYTGGTTVNAGTLIVSGKVVRAMTVNAGTLDVTGMVDAVANKVFLNDNVTLRVTANPTSPAISSTGEIAIGDFEEPTPAANTATFANINSTTVAAVSAADLYIDKSLTINITSVIPVVGKYPLLQGTSSATVDPGATVTLGSLPANITATLVDDTTGVTQSIYLDVTAVSAPAVVWTGATNSVWDINTTNNWSPSKYQDGNIVTFDDSAGNTNVTLGVTVLPGILTFNNPTKNYTLSGAGSIGGVTGLTKTGAGNLSITTNNTYNGQVSISGGGTVTVGDGTTVGSLGGSGSITLDGSTLAFNRSDARTLNRAVIGTGGTLAKNGAGTLTMSSSGNTCDIIINNGTLVASGGSFANAFAAGKLITVNPGATLYTPGFHSMGSSVGGGDVPMVAINGGNWLLEHEQYMRTLTMTAGTTTGVPGNDGIRTLSGSIYTVHAAATSSVIGSPLNLFNDLSLVVDDGTAADDLVISGLISNSGAITKSGAGRVVFSGTNTYTGATTVTAGTLAVTGASIPDTNELVIDGGKVDVTVDETVNTLFIGATQQVDGTYGSTSSSAQFKDDALFAGTGVLTVVTGPAGYSAWAAANAPGQTLDQDHDNDGVSNGIEYFMGQSGSGFTVLPGLAGGKASWPKGATYPGVYGTDYWVETSPDLSIWTLIDAADPNLNNTNPLEYTLPVGNTKVFTRLVVTGP